MVDLLMWITGLKNIFAKNGRLHIRLTGLLGWQTIPIALVIEKDLHHTIPFTDLAIAELVSTSILKWVLNNWVSVISKEYAFIH